MGRSGLAIVLVGALVFAGAARAGAAPFAYITNSGDATVSVIDTTTNTVVATVPVGIGPYGIAVTPDGAHVYVANAVGNTVSVIATATNTVVATVSANGPSGVAVTPDGAHVYVANLDDSTVSVIDTATNIVVATVVPIPGLFATQRPLGVAVTPDGTHVYVAYIGTPVDAFGAGVWVIDTATNSLVQVTCPGFVQGCGIPSGVAVAPDGPRAYVTSSFPNVGQSAVSVIDTATNTVVALAAVTNGDHLPFGLLVTPDGARVYVANFNDSTVSVIDTATNAVVATVAVGGRPVGVAVTPDGAHVYAANNNDSTVSVIATATNTVVATVAVGSFPIAFGQFIQPVTPVQLLNVAIDIKPGSSSNSINPNSQGLIPVAILSSASFDAPARVDLASLTFGQTGQERSLAFCNAAAEDVNLDGLPDLVCHFFTNLTEFQSGDTAGVLKGTTVDGKPIMGTDSVRIVH